MTTIQNAQRPLRIIFAGTPDFAALSLAALIDSQHSVVAAYCHPDRPTGRGRKLVPGPVKALATQHEIPVLQPVSLKDPDAQRELEAFGADLMVVAAYGLILPTAVLEAPRFGCINVHASLLPRWRGAAPIQHALLAGDEQTGITIMQMDAGLDTGDMLYRKTCELLPTDTGSSLHDRLATLGGEALLHVLNDLEAFQREATPQAEAQTTYAAKITKLDAALDWSQSATELARRVRAFNAWPVCFSELQGQRVRIWEAQADAYKGTAQPGVIIASSPAGIEVACADGLLRLLRIQLPGAKALSVADVLNAHRALFASGNQFNPIMPRP